MLLGTKGSSSSMIHDTGFERLTIKIRGVSMKSSDWKSFAASSIRTVLSSHLQ